MKFSKFNVLVLSDSGKSSVIYNTLTKAIAVIDPDLLAELKSGFLLNNLQKSKDEDLKDLIQSGILIEDSMDENQLLIYHINRSKFSYDVLSLLVLTTSDCNLSCKYCFQGLEKKSVNMSDEMSVITSEWIKKRTLINNSKIIRVSFFGGEPLYNKKAINIICQHLFQDLKNVNIEFFLITNGTLFDDEVLNILYKYNFKGIQITLDGTEEIHDKRRPFKSGKGSFSIVFSNFLKIVDFFNVVLVINYDRENLDNIADLLKYISQRGVADRSILLFNPIQHPLVPLEHCVKYVLPNQLQGEWQIKFEKKAHKMGFKKMRAFEQRDFFCTANADNSFVIDPSGNIYKCGAFVGHEEFMIGNVSESELKYRNIEFMTVEPWRECLDCCFVPLCGGGCRFLAYRDLGNYKSKVCDLQYFKFTFPELLKIYFSDRIEEFENTLSN